MINERFLILNQSNSKLNLHKKTRNKFKFFTKIKLENPYEVGKQVSTWLTVIYFFWIGFIVAIILSSKMKVAIGVMFIVFVIIGLFMLWWLLIIFKQQVGFLSNYPEKITGMIFVPILYWWFGRIQQLK